MIDGLHFSTFQADRDRTHWQREIELYILALSDLGCTRVQLCPRLFGMLGWPSERLEYHGSRRTTVVELRK